MKVIDFMFNIIIDDDKVYFNKRIIRSNFTSISNKLFQIRKYFEDTDVTKIFTIEATVQDNHYIVGFDPTSSYFYFLNCITLEIDYFISKEAELDSSYLCLVYPILRKEITIDY